MNGRWRLLLVFVLALTASCGTGTAGFVVQHIGDADPTTEGWTALPDSGGRVDVGSVDDGGTPAWFVDDNSMAGGSTFFYDQAASSADIEAGNSAGWILSTTLRVASDESPSFDGSPFVAYRDGANTWQMNFGLDGSGDTSVRLYTGVTTGPTHVFSGNSTYNTFLLRFDPITASADLFVNGVEVISDYVGEPISQTRVVWGAGRSRDQGQGNFSEVRFAVVPEPSSIALWGIACLALFAARRWGYQRLAS